jgi:hypothetical protein
MTVRTAPLSIGGRLGGRAPKLVAAVLGLPLLMGIGVALAFWTAADSSNPAGAAGDTLPAGATPTAATTPAANSTTVGVAFATSATTAGGRSIAAYTVSRYGANGSVSKTFTCTAAQVNSSTCQDSAVPDGSWRYTEAATISQWQGSESAKSAPVVVDTTAPTATVSFPAASAFYNAAGFNAGCAAAPFNAPGSICGTASDPGASPSGVSSVKVSIQSTSGATSGKYWGGSSFNSSSETKLSASFSGGNWTLSFAGSNFAADGTYAVRSYATDAAANTQSTATATTFSIDNTAPALAGPVATAATTSGSNPVFVNSEVVTLTDPSTDTGGSGVKSVAYYYCAASAGSCTSANGTLIGSSTTSAGNFSVASNAPLAADGAYKIVAVATDNAGNASSPSTATLLTVDTAPPTTSRPIVNGNP